MCKTPYTRKEEIGKALLGDFWKINWKKTLKPRKILSGKLIDTHKPWRNNENALSYKRTLKATLQSTLLLNICPDSVTPKYIKTVLPKLIEQQN